MADLENINPEQLNQIIGENIKKNMKLRGYSQNELAELCGMNKTKMSYKIRNLQKFTFYEVLRICDEFLLSVNELIEGV